MNIFSVLRQFFLIWVVLSFLCTSTTGQELETDTLSPIGRKELEKMKRRVPLSQDTLKQLKYGGIYIQTGGVAVALAQGILASNDLIFLQQSSPGGTFEKNTIGRYLPYVYPLATGVGLNIWSRNAEILPPRANMYVANSAIGTLIHGPMLGEIIFGIDEMEDVRGGYLSIAAVGIAEGWIHYWYSGRRKFNYAQTAAWSTGNLWGALISFHLTRDISELINSEQPRNLAPYAGLAGSVLGVYVSNRMFKNNPRTTGDFRVLNTGMMAAMLYTNGIFRSIENSGSSRFVKPAFTIAQLSSFAASFLLTQHTKFSDQEGLYIAGVSGIGGVFGLLRYNSLVQSRNNRITSSAEFFIGSGMLMGLGAAYIGANLLRTPKVRQRSRQSYLPNIQFNPAGVLVNRFSEQQQRELLQANAGLSMVQIEWKF